MTKNNPVITLEPRLDARTGEVVYIDVEAQGGAINAVPDTGRWSPTPAPQAVSKLPQDRMCADWETIVNTLRAQENGQPTPFEVVVEPGGVLTTVSAVQGQQRRPISKLPENRMATVATVGPSSADAQEIRRLDPSNVENWTPVWYGEFGGWTFEMTPPFPSQGRFLFLVFRSPGDGNALRISPLRPNLDDQFGHTQHMITVRLGGQEVPILCGPQGEPARNFAEVRGHAAKWMVYTSYRMAGLQPPFSE